MNLMTGGETDQICLEYWQYQIQIQLCSTNICTCMFTSTRSTGTCICEYTITHADIHTCKHGTNIYRHSEDKEG